MFGIFKRVKALEARLNQTRNEFLKDKYVGKYAESYMLPSGSHKILDARQGDEDVEIKIHTELGCIWQYVMFFTITNESPKAKEIRESFNSISQKLDDVSFGFKVADTHVVNVLRARLDALQKAVDELKAKKAPVKPKAKKK